MKFPILVIEKFKIVKEDIYLGRVKYDDLDTDTSNIVFKLTQGQTSQILKTSFVELLTNDI